MVTGQSGHHGSAGQGLWAYWRQQHDTVQCQLGATGPGAPRGSGLGLGRNGGLPRHLSPSPRSRPELISESSSQEARIRICWGLQSWKPHPHRGPCRQELPGPGERLASPSCLRFLLAAPRSTGTALPAPRPGSRARAACRPQSPTPHARSSPVQSTPANTPPPVHPHASLLSTPRAVPRGPLRCAGTWRGPQLPPSPPDTPLSS